MNSLKYFKRGWNGNEGRGNKDFEKGVCVCVCVCVCVGVCVGGGGGGGLEPSYELSR